MTRRLVVFLVIAVLAAAVCVRLGFWQLSRLAQRRAHNRELAVQLGAPPVPYAALPPDSAGRHYRRVAVAGRADYAREFVLVNRQRDGAPGVHVITPVHVTSGGTASDTLVLVDRGWLYSPDGTDVDLTTVREPDSLAVTGYVEIPSRLFGAPRLGAPGGSPNGGRNAPRPYRAYRYLDPDTVAADLGAPVTRDYVVAEPPADESRPPFNRLKRLSRPDITDEGRHQSYAIQWFSFATISLLGAAAFARAERRRAR